MNDFRGDGFLFFYPISHHRATTLTEEKNIQKEENSERRGKIIPKQNLQGTKKGSNIEGR